ncbi:branched-chain amino acid aminotransferase [Lutibacter agarilyticus]|uniref:branched-chain-amino-acid transaminase n=1 Tax=Lutibacter agarilyticus TaxID=1109740 RepID=A0A238WX68_9FLAO|nr:aminotransferase class IV [Lutibacter agarilyticus]SNR50834.1 branched-chain amino acid aminotransferase [Lutibacter agarilyticus]
MINFNGNLTASNLVLSSNNRAFKYGDGIFETIKVENLDIRFLEDHYFRLMASMRMLRMEIPMEFTMDFIEQEIIKTVQCNNLNNARVRVSVYREDGGLYTPKSNKINFIIEASELNVKVKDSYVLDLFKDFYVYSGLLSTVKTTNKLVNVLASIYADENAVDNCILLNEKKQVVEVMNGTIFLVVGNTIKTPAITEGCVKGIIRKKIIEIITAHPVYTIEETQISPFEIQKADEVFITNTIIGVQPVTNYKKNIFETKVSKELALALANLV